MLNKLTPAQSQMLQAITDDIRRAGGRCTQQSLSSIAVALEMDYKNAHGRMRKLRRAGLITVRRNKRLVIYLRK